MKICKLCGKPSELVKAHIIPLSFYKHIIGGKREILRVIERGEQFDRKSPVGIYDQSILCSKCDSDIGKFDSYAKEILLDRETEFSLHPGLKNTRLHVLKNVDYTKFKLFVISLVWRASITTRREFSSVSLGLFETRAKELIEKNDPGSKNDFSFFIIKYNPGKPKVMRGTCSRQIQNIPVVDISLAHYFIIVKISTLPWPPEILPFAFGPEQDLLVIEMELANLFRIGEMEWLIERVKKLPGTK